MISSDWSPNPVTVGSIADIAWTGGQSGTYHVEIVDDSSSKIVDNVSFTDKHYPSDASWPVGTYTITVTDGAESVHSDLVIQPQMPVALNPSDTQLSAWAANAQTLSLETGVPYDTHIVRLDAVTHVPDTNLGFQSTITADDDTIVSITQASRDLTLTGLKAGTTVLTLTSGDKKVTTRITVTVTDPAPTKTQYVKLITATNGHTQPTGTDGDYTITLNASASETYTVQVWPVDNSKVVSGGGNNFAVTGGDASIATATGGGVTTGHTLTVNAVADGTTNFTITADTSITGVDDNVVAKLKVVVNPVPPAPPVVKKVKAKK